MNHKPSSPTEKHTDEDTIPEKVDKIILDLHLWPRIKPVWILPSIDALGTWRYAQHVFWPPWNWSVYRMVGPFLYWQLHTSRSCQLWWIPSCLHKCCSALGLFSVHPWSVSWDHSPVAYLPFLISEGRCLNKQIAFIILTSPEKLSRFWPVLDPTPKWGYILGFASGHPILTVDKK